MYNLYGMPGLSGNGYMAPQGLPADLMQQYMLAQMLGRQQQQGGAQQFGQPPMPAPGAQGAAPMAPGMQGAPGMVGMPQGAPMLSGGPQAQGASPVSPFAQFQNPYQAQAAGAGGPQMQLAAILRALAQQQQGVQPQSTSSPFQSNGM